MAYFHTDVRWTMGHVPCLQSFWLLFLSSMAWEIKQETHRQIASWHTFVKANNKWDMEKPNVKNKAVHSHFQVTESNLGSDVISCASALLKENPECVSENLQKEPCVNKETIYPKRLLFSEPLQWMMNSSYSKASWMHHKSDPHHLSSIKKSHEAGMSDLRIHFSFPSDIWFSSQNRSEGFIHKFSLTQSSSSWWQKTWIF